MPPWVVATLALVSLVVASCAKQPATTVASRPAPTALSGVGPPTAVPGASAPSATAPNTPSTQWIPNSSAERAPLKDFAPIADLPDIYFAFDRYDLTPAAQRTLGAHALWLRTQTRAALLIEGHSDERGTNEYNVALGERRARAAMNHLISRGIDARRITILTYGEQRPQCWERDEACWAKNRRARFLVKIQ
jgi:peptidoglycan-associated lipoprotein